MPQIIMGPDINQSALLIVDMQNDFVHSDGGFAHRARENPDAKIALPFLMGTIPQVKGLADAFRKAGRPVVYIAHRLKPDIPMLPFPIGARHPGKPAAAIVPSLSRAPGAPRSSTS
jgi:ureidoacrylate peracid hydrolase